jgi:hypothetical protein
MLVAHAIDELLHLMTTVNLRPRFSFPAKNHSYLISNHVFKTFAAYAL